MENKRSLEADAKGSGGFLANGDSALGREVEGLFGWKTRGGSD